MRWNSHGDTLISICDFSTMAISFNEMDRFSLNGYFKGLYGMMSYFENKIFATSIH